MKRRLPLVALLLLPILSCRNDRTMPPPSAETPVFIISVDTLRSDRLPMYGYKEIETPNLDALRRDGVLYERAYSHTPLTLPSHASMLTGLLPSEHGLRDNIGFRLDESTKSIAEVLQERGYATGAAISSWVLRKETGLNRGFDFYDDAVEALSGRPQMIATIQRVGGETVNVATDWIGKQNKPVFFLLHLYDPHTPYDPPEPYRNRYSHAYDGEIAYVDSVVGTFIDDLKRRGLYDRSLILFLSDHGEGLNDHGEEEHGIFLYREAIQVPLVVKLPDQRFAGETVGTAVQLIDVVPTIVDRTGIPFPAKVPGRSLTSLIGAKSPENRPVYSETYYPRFHYGWADQHSLIDGDRHYIHSPRPELYDLGSDFAETTNILESDRRGYFAMRSALEPMIREAAEPSPVDPEDAAKLAALGYLGSTVQTHPDEVLPDPKDHISSLALMSRAFNAFRDKKYDEALRITNDLLAANPRILDIYELKVRILTRLGRADEAIAAGKEGLRISPRATHLALEIAKIMLEVGRLDEAEKHAELAVKTEPGQAHDVMSRIFVERKDLASAEREAKLAVETDSDRVLSLLTLARVEREQGKLESALGRLDEALSRKKPDRNVPMLHFLRGDVLARMGRVDEAEREFRREIELHPDDPSAYKNLVLLLVADGRIPEATQLIRTLVATSPTPPSYLAVCHVLETLGDTNGVRYWARQGLARYPDHPDLRRLAG